MSETGRIPPRYGPPPTISSGPGPGPVGAGGRTRLSDPGPSLGGVTEVAWTGVDAPIGPLLVAGTPAGLVLVGFRAGPAYVERALGALGRRLGCAVVADAARLD